MYLMFLLSKRIAQKNVIYYLKQVIYFTLIIAIVLSLSSYYYLKYDNQQIFLKHMKYQSYDLSNLDGQFSLIETQFACEPHIEEGAYVFEKIYPVQCFIADSKQIDYEYTYFSKWATGRVDPDELQDGEAIISQDIANALQIEIGDSFSIFCNNENDDFRILTVASIMKTKYPYGSIGYGGTALIGLSEANKTFFADNVQFVTFRNDANGMIALEDEVRESTINPFSKSLTMVINVIFPVLGLILLLFTILREIIKFVSNSERQINIFNYLGMEKEKYIACIIILQDIALLLSMVGALIIYKYWYIQRVVREYVSIRIICFYSVISLVFLIFVSIVAGKYYTKKFKGNRND